MPIAYINCKLLDGSKDMTVRPNQTVIVDQGKIISIGETKDAKDVPENCQIVDLGGRYLMPGLINLHSHLPSSGKPSKINIDEVKLVKLVTSTGISLRLAQDICEKNAKMELMSGVTTIRTVGGIQNLDSIVRNRINDGSIDGPRLLVANTAISVVGGHMAGSLAYEATSAKEAENYVVQIAQDQPDLIKLMITGGVLDAKKKGEPGVLRMPPDFVKASCDKAHQLGYPVAAHVESTEGIKVALENGVDTIEHGAILEKEHVDLFKERKASLICTISPALPLALFDPEVSGSTEVTKYNGNLVMEGIIGAAKKALENDIPVGLGTDSGCPFVTHYDMWRELVYFHKYVKVSNAFALYTATKKNAEIAKIDDITGSIEVGKDADFLITEQNPLEDLKALRKPYMVVARGKYYLEPKIKKVDKVEQELDHWL